MLWCSLCYMVLAWVMYVLWRHSLFYFSNSCLVMLGRLSNVAASCCWSAPVSTCQQTIILVITIAISVIVIITIMLNNTMQCVKKGPFFWEWVPIGTFLGTYWFFRVPIFSVWGKFTRRISFTPVGCKNCCICDDHQHCWIANNFSPFRMVSIYAVTGSVVHFCQDFYPC